MNDIDSLQHFLQEQFHAHGVFGVSSRLEKILLEEHLPLSFAFDETKMQESWSWRIVTFARSLAIELIDEKGRLQEELVEKAHHVLRSSLYSLRPDRYADDHARRHVLRVLAFLQKSECKRALHKIQKPEANILAERLIRETLQWPAKEAVTTAHARRATLSALFAVLRQNVGSCFATAPAIIIHEEHPLQFLQDIADLFSFGRLSRTFQGTHFAIPLNANWGLGELFKPFSLLFFADDPLRVFSFSPGIQTALMQAGCIPASKSKEEMQSKCEALLKKALLSDKQLFFRFTSAYEILEKTLLFYFDVMKEEVESHLAHSHEAAFGELVLQNEKAKSKKTYTCISYLKAFDLAKKAFKSLTDNPLLKAWEFTLASFAEVKGNFAKHNFYISLGFYPEEKHGILSVLEEEITPLLQTINREIEEQQSNYDHLFAQAKYLEGRIKSVYSESEAKWVQAEYAIRRREIDRVLDLRDTLYAKANSLSQLPRFLAGFYGEKIPEFFQEVYDAEMQDISLSSAYDDAPAGFRLLYKHGRANPSLWTLVHSADEYLSSLASFFKSTEVELGFHSHVKGIEREISQLITAVLMELKRPEFLEHALWRLAKAYHEPLIERPLDHLKEIKRKPWSYVSGGNLAGLVSSYFGLEKQPEEVKHSVNEELDLLLFFIDTIKELPHVLQRFFRENREFPLLAFSPTHAFICKPGWRLFKEAWESNDYTYTWLRDRWIFPQQRFLDENELSLPMMQRLVQDLSENCFPYFRATFLRIQESFLYPLHPKDFRRHVLDYLSYEKWIENEQQLEWIGEEIDALLYRSLPFFSSSELKKRLASLFENATAMENPFMQANRGFLDFIEEASRKKSLFSALDLRNTAKAALLFSYGKVRGEINFHEELLKSMQTLKFSYPAPILIGDSNWVKNVFGFIVSPGSGKVEFWRFDGSGCEGRPIKAWKYLFGGETKFEWGIFTKPSEYGFMHAKI